MPINLTVGQTYIHKTLGLVKIIDLQDGVSIEVLTNKVKLSVTGIWLDDWGYNFRGVNIGSQWMVKAAYLSLKKEKLDPKDKGKSPVQIRCRKLWNQSNWVKAHPKQAY